MRRYISYALFLVLGLALLLFLVANRRPVLISMDPISTDDPAFFLGPMPLWAALMFTLVIGFCLGAFGMWLSSRGVRDKAQKRKKEIKRLEQELQLATNSPIGARGSKLPALRS
ncbi:integration host factor beta subunit [Parvularcula bermudensis HTCC2503]|uniref:Integration host factor beta subunit n=1 Tax=Parvularcula bermudensis (strain ATCC BAA-594 / HTCC2503 / KCTC 12087) TaxID=314260 RepID=E0TF78_PARBH|nr:LapA family protein [Parvularcula bermudensis]ADM08996.1 integration host factor beta subunit [Parvularcula bermudensis HTCC2503]